MDRQLPGLLHLQANNIFCIGRNYSLHAKEMKSEVPEEPMVFLKPNSALIFGDEAVKLPPKSKNVHHEVELVLAIGKDGKNIPRSDALEYLEGIAIGIDFTERDLQSIAKKNGWPWTLAKGFDTFAPVSSFISLNNFREMDGDLSNCKLELRINGKRKQAGNTSDLIFPVDFLISYLSTIFTLQPGDLIFTGTPEGVGPVHNGDRVQATLNSQLLTLEIDVQQI